MVYQMRCPGSKDVFAASSYINPEQAYHDLQHWAAANGYRLAEAARAFTVYGHNQQPRQWMLLERSQAESRRD